MSDFKIPTERPQLIIMAKVAEQCERYDEMLVCMKRAVAINAALSQDEKNLLSVAYKNVIGARRAPWRTVSALEAKSADESTMEHKAIVSFKNRLTDELADICNDMFALLSDALIPAAADDEAKVFFYKLKADYHRYYVEAASGNVVAEQAKHAREAYEAAEKHAVSLPPSSPVKLGLLLNFSVFQYEIEKQMEAGYEKASEAFQASLPELDKLPDDDYRESATIMSLLRDNLNTWAEALNKGERQDDMEMEDC